MPKIELPKQTLDDIEEGLQRAKDLDEFLNRHELAGFDVTNLRTNNEEQRNVLRRIKQAHFPTSL